MVSSDVGFHSRFARTLYCCAAFEWGSLDVTGADATSPRVRPVLVTTGNALETIRSIQPLVYSSEATTRNAIVFCNSGRLNIRLSV